MAITNTEKKQIQELKAQGFSLQEIQGHLAGKRLGRAGSIQAREAEAFKAQQPSFIEQTATGIANTIKDIPSDVKEGFEGAVESVSGAMQESQDIRQRVEEGETSPVSGTFQTMGAGLQAGAETLGQGVLVAGKAFAPQGVEEAIAKTVGQGAEAIVKSRPAEEVQNIYEGLNDEQKRNVQALLGTTEGVTTLFGFSPIVNRLKASMPRVAQSSLKASDDILERTRQAAYDLPKVDIPNTRETRKVIKKLRLAVTRDIDPQVEDVLKRSDFNEVNRYFQQAREAVGKSDKDTPMAAIAGNKAEEAYNAINEARIKAIQGKNSILNKVASERVPGNTINDVMSDGITRMKSKFGAKVNSNGTIVADEGRILKLDNSDQKLVSEYFSRLNSMGVSPTVKEVDDFVDWAQGQLYKQSKTISKLDVASEPIVKELQGITGDLNSRLKNVVGGGYGEVNARISNLIELQDELSRALGADARKGAGLIKRLFSTTRGDDTRRIFRQVQKETGIDLAKEATLAKFSMESVGDTRQASLLKELDAGADVADRFELTNPISWYQTIRERLDLDGQDLANEIIRRNRSD